MAADAWKLYDSFKEKNSDGTIDLDDVIAGAYKCALFTSTLVPAQTDNLYSALANEVVAGNGYATGGVALTSITWIETAGVITWDADDIIWSAVGGSIIGRYAIIYHVASSQLIAMCLMDNTPANVEATDGNDLKVQHHANGIFQESGGW